MFKSNINRLLLAVVLLNLCALVGCHRSFYRRQADAEARRLIKEKASDPRWNSADGTIEVDPQSRMFNPFSQDHPPIPPDDATSHQLMRRVNGKEAYPHWHANGDTNFVENPEWRAFLPTNEEGQVVLNLERAYRLALIHSPTLQQQRETLYASAIDVSLQRFGFDSQLFTGFNSFLTTQGRLRAGNGGQSSTTLQNQIGANGGGLNLERLGITGTNFAVGLANTVLFNLAGNNTQSANSLIDFSIIQPLLRGAGRERILESLTQSERTLLANVRQLERFRRGFYLQIAIGRNPGAGPNAGGNFLGAPGPAPVNAGGFFGLLQQQQVIRNQEFNVRQLEGVLEQFREFFLRERLDAVSLKLFETGVYDAQRGLLDSKNNYQASLDAFKLTLGLPPELEVVIDDSYLDRFELISDQVNERLISISQLREETGRALNEVTLLYDDIDKPDFEWPSSVSDEIDGLIPFLDKAAETLESITNEDREQLEADFNKMESKREARLEYLKNLQAAIESGQINSEIDPDLLEGDSIVKADILRQRLEDPEASDSIMKRAGELRQSLKEIRERVDAFAETEKELLQVSRITDLDANDDGKLTRDELRNRTQAEFNLGDVNLDGEIAGKEIEDLASLDLLTYISDEFIEVLPGQLTDMNNLILEISLLQALARSDSIEVSDINIDSKRALEIARCMRRDWMNARASLVDSYRNIEFVADQLEAEIDLVFQGDIGNTGDNPFRLRYETGQLQVGFRFDSPIVRMSERNQYRQALINYQQSRRQLYQFEDNVSSNLRNIIRNVERSKILFELDRRRVQTQIENVEINRLQLDEPVAIGATQSQVGANTARNLTDAINNLNGTQNSFLGTWIQLEVLRRNLDFDMGTMQLDSMGEWIDPGQIDANAGIRAAQMMGIQLDCQFCSEANTFVPPPETMDDPEPMEEPEYNEEIQPAEVFNGENPERVPLEETDAEPIMEPPSPDTSGLMRNRRSSPTAAFNSTSKTRKQLNSRPSSKFAAAGLPGTGYRNSRVRKAITGSLNSIKSFQSLSPTPASPQTADPKELVSVMDPAFIAPVVTETVTNPISKSELESAIIRLAEKGNLQAADAKLAEPKEVKTIDDQQAKVSPTPFKLKRILPFAAAETKVSPFVLPSADQSVTRISNEFVESTASQASRSVEVSSTPKSTSPPIASPPKPKLESMPAAQQTAATPSVVPGKAPVQLTRIVPSPAGSPNQPAVSPLREAPSSNVKILRATASKNYRREVLSQANSTPKFEQSPRLEPQPVRPQPVRQARWESPNTPTGSIKPVTAEMLLDKTSTKPDKGRLKTTTVFGHSLNSQKDAFKWKAKSSSLDGVLERFRSEEK